MRRARVLCDVAMRCCSLGDAGAKVSISSVACVVPLAPPLVHGVWCRVDFLFVWL